MNWRLLAVVAGAVLTAAPAAAADATIESFAGTWRGTALEVGGDAGDLALEPADLDVQIEADGAGFRMSWTSLARHDGGTLERQKVEARFTPTDRPGVYAFAPGGSSLLSQLFADPETGNPLEGDALLWARLTGSTLTVYSLAVDYHGGLELDRYARTISDAGLDVRYSHRMEDDRILTIEGRLAADGG
jgi:hypothetical protein